MGIDQLIVDSYYKLSYLLTLNIQPQCLIVIIINSQHMLRKRISECSLDFKHFGERLKVAQIRELKSRSEILLGRCSFIDSESLLDQNFQLYSLCITCNRCKYFALYTAYLRDYCNNSTACTIRTLNAISFSLLHSNIKCILKL